ncbi:MAG: protein-glutamate O-methyltransferase [Acidobacteriia bacterium]|nr:protein-glutamate O-methyltransferase [Terriglobia bacterium]
MPVAGEIAPLSVAEFRGFRDLILDEAGIYLKDSKRSLVESRLGRRLRSLGIESYGEYFQYVTRQPAASAERREMINCITTNKTDFFRENHHFEFVRDRLIPQARARAAAGESRKLRIWSAGCSTGEEPYSIAMTICEALGTDRSWDVRILASDVDTEVLAAAEQGIYDGERLERVPETVVRRHFLRNLDRSAFQVKEDLKSMIRFRRINLVEPAWPIRASFDAIFCRNVIIYFNQATQQRLFERLTGYLKPSGYLMVGHSENLQWLNAMLELVQSTIYRLRDGAR